MISDVTYGSVLGGQTLVLSGDSYGPTAGTVLLDGRPCSITTWATDSIAVVTPKRLTNGRIIATADVVDIVVTLPDNVTTFTTTFTFQVTVLDLALNAIRNMIATIDPATDPNYSYTIGPSNIINYQQAVETVGNVWPKVLVYAGHTNYSSGQDKPIGFYTGKTRCVAQATLQLSKLWNWDIETRLLMADLCRAIQLQRSFDPYALSYDIVDAYAGQATDKEAVALGIVTVEFDIIWRHVRTNWNTVTRGE